MRDKLAALWVYLADDFGEVALRGWWVLNVTYIVAAAVILLVLVF